jgi:hypothetical protein
MVPVVDHRTRWELAENDARFLRFKYNSSPSTANVGVKAGEAVKWIFGRLGVFLFVI